MTRDKDFKALVRARMCATGENYTAARTFFGSERTIGQVDAVQAARDQARLVSRWFDRARLRSIPARHKVRAAVLLEVLTHFVPGEALTEPDVNRRLRPVHEDVAYLRRELVGLGYLERDRGTYRVARGVPLRSRPQRGELPAWEVVWLPGFLDGTTLRPVTSDGRR